MIVSELIDKLKTFPPEARVVGRGYESGYNDLDDVEMKDLLYIPDNPWYDGKYQIPSSYFTEKHEQTSIVIVN